MPRDSRRLPLRPKDLWHIPAGGRREPSRWVGGGSKVGEIRPCANTVDDPVHLDTAFVQGKDASGSPMFGPDHIADVPRWVTSRAPRGKGGGRPGDFVEVARHRRIPEKGRGSASSRASADAGKFDSRGTSLFSASIFKESHGEARHVRYDRYRQRDFAGEGLNARASRGSITIYFSGGRACMPVSSLPRTLRSTAIRTAASDRSIEQCGAEAGGAGA